jgi:hypothetical protein
VYLDGRHLGDTPLSREVPVGVHEIEVRPFGERPGGRHRVRIRSGGTTRRVIALR